MSDQTPSGKPNPSDKPIFDVTSLPKNAEELRNLAGNIPSIEDLGQMADDKLKDAPPHVQKAVGRGINLYLSYKQEIAIALIGLVFLKLYKRRISRKTTIKILKTLETTGKGAPGSLAPNGTTYPDLFQIVEDLRNNPGMAYIPHGGGMVHLLKGKDALLTVFGEFEEMTDKEIWSKVADVLGLATYNRATQ